MEYSIAHIKEAYCRHGLRKKKMDYTVGKISSCREGSIFVDIISEIINTPPIAVREQLLTTGVFAKTQVWSPLITNYVAAGCRLASSQCS